MPHPCYTVGHSTGTFEALVQLLQRGGVEQVVDVRRFPRSRRHPQFNLETLPGELASHGIDYRHAPELGGRRGKAPPPACPNDYWTHRGFRNYADYALTPEFRHGLDLLRASLRQRPCAIMCSEAVWWRCHRRIIADYLLAAGEHVFHLLPPAACKAATMTPAAKPCGDGLCYPAAGG